MGRGQEAEIILRRIEEQAGVTRLPPASQRPSPPVLRVSIWVLFSRAVIRRTLLAIFVNIICLFGSHTLTGWMPTFFVKQGMSVTHSLAFNSAMMAGFVAGPILCMVFADRIGVVGDFRYSVPCALLLAPLIRSSRLHSPLSAVAS